MVEFSALLNSRDQLSATDATPAAIDRGERSPPQEELPSARDRSRVDESAPTSDSRNAAGVPKTVENNGTKSAYCEKLDNDFSSSKSQTSQRTIITKSIESDLINDTFVTKEIFKLSEHGLKIDHDARRSDDHHCLHLLKTTTAPDKEGGSQQHSKVGFQLRALSETGLSTPKTWTQQRPPAKTVTTTKDINVPFSTELVAETLNYFVNCQQRLSQMTKTYDDSDAYLLLLQEKEVDLELAARIGQDLLKQNNQLKESLKQVEEELSERIEEVQQLKHELATKVSLLETFREEEEDEYNCSNAETSKETNICNKPSDATQKLVENVTFQLVESNKRLCELQDELLFKGEQSLLQQEKIFRLEEQLRDSDRRLDDVATENESLQKSMIQSVESQNETAEELRICKRNFSELLAVFLEMQKESRINRNLEQVPAATFYGDVDLVNDINNISFDSFTDIPQAQATNLDSFNCTVDSGLHTADITSSNSPTSLSTNTDLEDRAAGGESSSEEDSHSTLGESLANTNLETNNTDDEEDHEIGRERSISQKKSWLNFSSFMLSTIVLLCLSATFNSTTNSNLATRIHQLKLHHQ